ncbi:MAG TPA: type II toxin-antitoxin system HicA family toxin [bacterium]|nr:type II toxin-antitoxin system HicA family toxin [bacterium]
MTGACFCRQDGGATFCKRLGSHHIYGKSGSIVRLSVPVHGSKPLRIGLLKHL